MNLKMIAVLGALALPLSGCITDGLPPLPPLVNPTPGQVVTDAQNLAMKVCGFVPTAETVLDIFLSANPIYTTGESIANAICGALTKTSARRGAAPPTVAGVRVRGSFVRHH